MITKSPNKLTMKPKPTIEHAETYMGQRFQIEYSGEYRCTFLDESESIIMINGEAFAWLDEAIKDARQIIKFHKASEMVHRAIREESRL